MSGSTHFIELLRLWLPDYMGKTKQKKNTSRTLQFFLGLIKVKNMGFCLVHTIQVSGVLGIKESEETPLTNLPSNIPPKKVP